MSRRGRAVAFLLLALRGGGVAAAIADGYGAERRAGLRRRCARSSSLERDPAGRRADRLRESRRGAGGTARPAALRPARRARRARRRARPRPEGGAARPAPTCSPRSCGRRGAADATRPASAGDRRPVEIAVSGAGALLAAGPAAAGARRSTSSSPSEPTGPGPGAPTSPPPACRCWRWSRAPTARARAARSAATLGLTRPQALRLIAAESFARKVTLLPEGERCRARGSAPGGARRLAARPAGRAPPRPAAAAGRCRAGDLRDEVDELVDEEAALLGARPIARSLARGSSATPSASARWRTCSPTRAVEEVMVNGPERVYVERSGRIEPADVAFADEEELRNAIERILAPLGRRVDELSPMVDARLADGSRVNVVIPPLAIDGPALSIRRFGAQPAGPGRAGRAGNAERGAARPAGARPSPARRSVLISGGTGSGKTTLLNALSSFIAAGERVVTIEDAAELRLQQPHVVRLESRPAERRGQGGGDDPRPAPQRAADAARPDRDRRGARRRGARPAHRSQHRPRRRSLHVHANSPADALSRLETLALMAGVGLPHEAIAEQVRRGIDLVVHLERRRDGSRRVAEIADRGAEAALEQREWAAPRLARRCGGGPDGARRAGGAAGEPRRGRWLRLALEPLRRAGGEGYAPSTLERRRLAAVGAGAALLAGWLLGGPSIALPLAVAGPSLAAARSRGAAGATGPRSSAPCPRSPPRSPTRSAPDARCAPHCRPRRARSTVPPRSSWRGSAPSSSWARRPPMPWGDGGGGCARHG